MKQITYSNLRYLLLVAAFFFLGGCDVSVTNNKKLETIELTPEEQSVVLQVSKDFLNKLDQGDFEIWDELSKTIHQTTNKTAWKILTKTMRKAPGKIIKRNSYGMVCTEALPGAPEGRYIIIDINSTFERAELTERVVTVLEDGSWKIAGYHMNKRISFKQENS